MKRKNKVNKKKKIISIVIPAWNEERTLEKLVNIVNKLNFPGMEKEIICVNDASTDRTWEIMKRLSKKLGIKAINNKKNLGKSQSVRRGIMISKGDIVVVQDADLELEPKDLIPMAEIINRGEADGVFGNRYSSERKNKVSLANYVGNKILTTTSNLFTAFRGMRVPDMEVCYKMLEGDAMRKISKTIVSKTVFGIEPEITAKVSRYRAGGKKLRIKSYPITYYPRSAKEGKKIKYISDGWKAVKEILRFNLGN